MTTEFHQQYIEEAKEVLKNLEQSLLHLEKSQTSDELNNAYRYLHTLKGSAGMFGFSDIERLAHELETVYDEIRDAARPFDEHISELTLHAIDLFSELLDGKDRVKEVDALILSVTGAKQEAHAQTTSTDQRGSDLYFIQFMPEAEVFKRGVNLNGILDDLRALGPNEIIVLNEITPLADQIAAKKLTSSFEIFISTAKSFDEVAEVFFFLKGHEFAIYSITDRTSFEKTWASIGGDQASLENRLSILEGLKPGISGNVEAAPVMVEATAVENTVTVELNDDSVISRKKSRKGGHVNVATEKLDHLINVVSELVIFRSEIQHLMEDTSNVQIVEALEKLERLTLGLRDSAFNIRLVPLSILNVKLQRLIRSVSKDLGKEIEFITEGLDTELDRSMISALEAPLMHLIRNAIDHGIETPDERETRNKPRKGLIKLYSYNSGDHVFIQLQDDGNGIDFDKVAKKAISKGLLSKNQEYTEKDLLNIMMSPGFSTAEKITTVSGRGVGLDVVKKEISSLRGDIEVSTEKELGSIFTLRLPLTLTVLDTLVVQVESNKYLLPISEVEHCFKEQHDVLFNKKSRQVNYEGNQLPFYSLREQFSLDTFPTEETVIVVNKNDRRLAIVVDNIVGTLQTVYKPLNELLHDVECFSGSSILGDGSMAFILNPLKLKSAKAI